jgi:hypothetical protein
MWIVYGITGEPWTPAGKNEDGTDMEQEWLPARGLYRKKMAVPVFVILTYIAAWAWMKWVDTACARATQWLETKVFEDEDSGAGKEGGVAEKGFSRPQILMNGYGPANGGLVMQLDSKGEPKAALV